MDTVNPAAISQSPTKVSSLNPAEKRKAKRLEARLAADRVTPTQKLTVDDLVANNRIGGIALRSHPEGLRCLTCGADMNRVGITKIVYTFEVCNCDAATYDHLREQLWHRQCFDGKRE
jgi:hypothetical protein